MINTYGFRLPSCIITFSKWEDSRRQIYTLGLYWNLYGVAKTLTRHTSITNRYRNNWSAEMIVCDSGLYNSDHTLQALAWKVQFLAWITLLVRSNLCSGLNLYFSGPKLYILYIMVESIKWRVHVIKSKTIATNTFQARVRSLIRHEVIRTSFYFSLNIINIIIPFQFLFILPLFLSITF